eukprot:scaffold104284_cov64-Attheya_sp.AAC.1
MENLQAFLQSPKGLAAHLNTCLMKLTTRGVCIWRQRGVYADRSFILESTPHIGLPYNGLAISKPAPTGGLGAELSNISRDATKAELLRISRTVDGSGREAGTRKLSRGKWLLWHWLLRLESWCLRKGREEDQKAVRTSRS